MLFFLALLFICFLQIGLLVHIFKLRNHTANSKKVWKPKQINCFFLALTFAWFLRLWLEYYFLQVKKTNTTDIEGSLYTTHAFYSTATVK